MLETYAAHPIIANALIFGSGAFVAFIGIVLFDFLDWKRQDGGRHVSSRTHKAPHVVGSFAPRPPDPRSEIERWWEI